MAFRVLGIETSCDETSAAVVAGGQTILSNVVSSQIDIHSKYGGVVPEIASRKHVESILPVVVEALDCAGVRLDDIDGVAVTNGPGLAGALLVGVSFAKALAFSRGLPLTGVNHLEGHLYANWLVEPDMAFPVVCLIVSGGHTDLVLVKGHGVFELVGRTRDDAAGEAFDKAARVMGLGYPGGPSIQRAAEAGVAGRIRLPRAYLEENTYDFSFSGLKTAVVLAMEKTHHEWTVADLAAEFQEAVAEVLVSKTLNLAAEAGVGRIALAGGVAANAILRKRMAGAAAARGIHLIVPPPGLCTDNAAMVATAGYYRFAAGLRSDLELNAEADLPFAGYEQSCEQTVDTSLVDTVE
ncbi:MAG: tRNA (adenosine(37)-N6)-threonylcarbamoyltransferase complex transferase subunit TsaD [Ignavibacteriales bacterium]